MHVNLEIYGKEACLCRFVDLYLSPVLKAAPYACHSPRNNDGDRDRYLSARRLHIHYYLNTQVALPA